MTTFAEIPVNATFTMEPSGATWKKTGTGANVWPTGYRTEIIVENTIVFNVRTDAFMASYGRGS